MPKLVPVDEEQELALSPNVVQPARPLVRAKVVYLGSNPNKSVILKGRIIEEPIEEAGEDGTVKRQVVKTIAPSTGHSIYDFTYRDSRGRVIPKKLMPPTHPDPEVRGKPFDACEHPDHLWEFAQKKMPDGSGRPEFKILAAGEARRVLEEYFFRKARASQTQRTLERQIMGEAV